MSRVMKVLAIVVLLVTVAGAGVVLYGINTLVPAVEQVSVTVTPAEQAQAVFDQLVSQLERETFAGKVFSDTDNLRASECALITYTVRVQNKGFFPAEWITLDVTPQGSEDVLLLADASAHVLGAGSRGDLTATLLKRGSAEDTARTLQVTCYVLGQKIVFSVQAQ